MSLDEKLDQVLKRSEELQQLVAEHPEPGSSDYTSKLKEIAELAPVDAPQLDSMFLDEGFGTLDPATLDVVAGAMEELASAGRMIGVVTHVADLAERMPAQFRVTKGPSTSTVELVSQ